MKTSKENILLGFGCAAPRPTGRQDHKTHIQHHVELAAMIDDLVVQLPRKKAMEISGRIVRHVKAHMRWVDKLATRRREE